MPAKTTASRSKKITHKIRYCSSRKPEPPALSASVNPQRAKLILQNKTKWATGTVLSYYFFDKKTDGAFAKNEDGVKVWKCADVKMCGCEDVKM